MRIPGARALALCSDLHVGDGTPRDDFQPHCLRFYEELAAMPPDVVPVIAGDFLDVLRYRMARILTSDIVWKICRELAARRAYVIRGNHDPSCALLRDNLPDGLNVCERLVLDEGYYLCHGHEFDLANGRWHAIGDAVTRIAAAAGRLDPRLEDWLARVAGRLQRVGRYSVEDKFVAHALGHIREWEGVHTIICGHTHTARVAVDPVSGKSYINLGAWSSDGFRVLDL